MNNLDSTSVLEITVLGLAIAQALMIILTIRRERDVNDLRELVEQQRVRLVELRAWLAGQNAAQPRRIAPERRPRPEPRADVREAGSEMPPPATGRPPRQPTAPTAEDSSKLFKDDPGEPREIVEARGRVTGRRKGYRPQAEGQDSPESVAIQPSNADDELDRINRAVTRLKEDLENSSEKTALMRKPRADLR